MCSAYRPPVPPLDTANTGVGSTNLKQQQPTIKNCQRAKQRPLSRKHKQRGYRFLIFLIVHMDQKAEFLKSGYTFPP
jgi:hypothetical protein